MKTRSYCVVTITALLFVVILSGPKVWAQGPPYQTDDPVPVELHHYEFYVFGAADGTPVEMDSVDHDDEVTCVGVGGEDRLHQRE